MNENIIKVKATNKNKETLEHSYLYDALSNLEEAATQTDHIEILYSKKANPLIQIQNGVDVHRGYDEDRVKTLSFLGETTHFNYDEFHKLESLTYNQKNIEFSYDKNQILTQRAYPNQQSEDLNYDASYNLLSIGDKEESTAYQYNKNSELIYRFNEKIDKEPSIYEYNQRGELSQAEDQSYSYSKAGNLIHEGQRYTHLNQLIENTNYLYTYDKRGNLQQKIHKETKEQTHYSFNLFDQLTKVIKEDKAQNLMESFSYNYDALGRRVTKTIIKSNKEPITHHYLYDEHNIVAILDQDKKLLATIVHDKEIDTPLSITTHQNQPRELTKAEAYHYEEFDEETKVFIEKKRKKRTYYYHRDHQGSITKLTDERSIIVERFIYDAYGKIVHHKKGIETLNPYCYTGREFDASGSYDIYYYRARYYDPNIGRFISKDPIEFLAGDFNFYRYVGGSPVNRTDPSGLMAQVGVAALEGTAACSFAGPYALICGAAAALGAYVLTKVIVDSATIVIQSSTNTEEKEEEVAKTDSTVIEGEGTGDPCKDTKSNITKYCKEPTIDLGDMKNLGEFIKNLERDDGKKKLSKKMKSAKEIKDNLNCDEIKIEHDNANKCIKYRKKMTKMVNENLCTKSSEDKDGKGHEVQEIGFGNRFKNFEKLLKLKGC